ncbi:hypothetical protein B7P43_G01482 [Cryptotermes secundus]|uniref:Reverse transcriptase domain-containing protein n=1 Tax=Cryptotermes secundus TaxID=105785 RepID=A0A2J7RK86_9NEOP|nr:hypothetical protein B7P43_G01482 [Cryptotermes secundus]
MPFGLCNAPATFERLMYNSFLVYLDDVIVIGGTFQEHMLNLRKVFERFREAHLKLNPEKCKLLQKEVRYLTHIVSPEDISTNPEKLKAAREWPTLKNNMKLGAFWDYALITGGLFQGFPTL